MNGKIILLLTAVAIASVFMMFRSGEGEEPDGRRHAFPENLEKTGLQVRDLHATAHERGAFEPDRFGTLQYGVKKLTKQSHRSGDDGIQSAAEISRIKKILFLIMTLSESKKNF